MRVELIQFRKKYRLYSRLLSEEFNTIDVFTLGMSLQHMPVRIVITLIIRDMSPLFCAQSLPGKSFPHVPVR